MSTFEPSDQLKAAMAHVKAEKKRAREIVSAAIQELYDAMAAEMIARPDIGPTEMGNKVGYTDGHVRRVVRKRGVPARVDVEPPKRRRREPGSDS